MADEQRLAGCQHAIVRNFQFRQRGGAGNWANFGGDIFARITGEDARRFHRFSRVDAADARVRVNRSHERHMQRPG